MKVLTISLALVVCVFTYACGSADQASPPPPLPEASKQPVSDEVPPAAAVSVPAAQHDGTVVMAGEHLVEVVSHASGQVYAYILSPSPPPGDVEIRVEVPVANRPPQRLTLVWNVRLKRYEGRVVDVVIVPGPLVVNLVVGAQVWIGSATTIVIAPAIVVEVRARKHKKHKKHKKHRKHEKH